MFYKPEEGHGLPHDPFKAIVSPRPIGWISTRASDGSVNVAPYSFFNAVAGRPPIVMFSSESWKDSARNARETGEFAVNLVGVALAEKMNLTSVDAPHGVSEFDYAGLTPAECRLIKAPCIAESHAVLECVVTEIFTPKNRHGEPISGVVVMGEAVGVHIDDALLAEGLFDVVKAGNVSRLGYKDYAAVTEIFSMTRPKWRD